MAVNANPNSIQIPMVWIGVEELPIQLLSQLLLQIQAPEEIILTIGQSAPPILAGTPEEQVAQATGIPFVPVRSLVRVSMTTNRVRDVIRVLTESLEKHEEIYGSSTKDASK